MAPTTRRNFSPTLDSPQVSLFDPSQSLCQRMISDWYICSTSAVCARACVFVCVNLNPARTCLRCLPAPGWLFPSSVVCPRERICARLYRLDTPEKRGSGFEHTIDAPTRIADFSLCPHSLFIARLYCFRITFSSRADKHFVSSIWFLEKYSYTHCTYRQHILNECSAEILITYRYVYIYKR